MQEAEVHRKKTVDEVEMRFADKIIQFIDNEEPRWGLIEKWKLREYIARLVRENEPRTY